MAETKKKGLDIPQTKGTYQIRGKVTGSKKESFYTEKITNTGKPWRSVNFGVMFKPDMTLFVGLNGMERDNVYFTKRLENGKFDKKTIPWKDRFAFAEDGFSLVGVNVGVTKTKDAKGNDVNDRKHLTDYDACKEISDHLTDANTVFVKGNIEYSSYQDGETLKRSTKFVPNQVSLARDVDFDAEDFTPNAKFTQTIVYMGITPNEDKTKFAVAAKIVNYNSIEDVEFIITDASLANVFRKQLKPYTSINVWGDISVERDTTDVETTDCWGAKNDMKRVNNPTKRELIITGADPETIDTTTYSEAEIDKAIETIKASKAAENDFGKQTDGWGSSKLEGDEEDMGW
jgi:hypothetical protein